MFDFTWFSDPSAWAALFTLTLLEIVLGIDNIVFISILVDRLPVAQRKLARHIGLGLAMISRLLLLFSLKWIMDLTNPIVQIPVHPSLFDMIPQVKDHLGNLAISWKDIIMLVGGSFLIFKSTKEIHHKLEDAEEGSQHTSKTVTFSSVLIQIMIIDVIFSLDSVITAVGMAKNLSVMAMAIVISVGIMMVASGAVSSFVSRHPSVKMLALSFLILIGTALIGEGFHFHIPKGYIYFAMAFSLIVELLNIRTRSKHTAKEVPQI
jgi:predicted tellurium resistance membrane protein TerC